MSAERTAIRELATVLRTADAQINSILGLTLSFADGLAIRLKALDRVDELLYRSGYSDGKMTPARAEKAEMDELLAAVGHGQPAGPSPSPGAPQAVSTRTDALVEADAAPVAPAPVDLDPADFEELEPEPVEPEPVEPESVEPEPVEIEPVDIEPVEIEPEPVEIEPEPVEIEPVELSPNLVDSLDEDSTEDETQIFQRGAIPMGFDDDDDESTVVMGADKARELMADIEEDHFDLVAPEEIEPEPLELDPEPTDPGVDDLRDEKTDEGPMEQFYDKRAATAAPQVRSASDRPGAAAVQLGNDGGARIMAPEEDEEIAVEAAPDEDDYDYDSEGGFGVSFEEEEYDEEEYEEEEEATPEPEPEPEPAAASQPLPEGPSQEVIDAFIAQAEREATEGSLDDAALYYSDALDGAPKSGEVRLARGRIYMDMGDYSRAASDFMLAEETLPESAEPQVLMGELYSHKKDYKKALGYLDIALRLDPRHPMAYYRRGLCLYKMKQYNRAVDDLGRARALDEQLPSIDHFLGQAMKKAKR